MKQIIIFGATGGTGKLLAEQALQKGFGVTVIVRNTKLFYLQHQNLQIIKGDVFNASTFEKCMQGKDAVISCLGVGNSKKPTTVYSEGISNIIASMKKNSVCRLICISAGAVDVPPKGNIMTKFFIKHLLQRIFKNLYSDMLVMEKLVKATDLNYTIVRPPWLRNTKLTRKYRVAVSEHLHNPTKISRADLAHYLVNNIDTVQTFKKTIELSY
ncbi:MAG: SDR family oxidoreductase [Ginsengibacter sp.]